ncbi:hypothetical protein [Clostridium botulinum]|uniref:hypothetical protein n=1 Tax=Clostridium botulinum TaxID=1491 RepID=UPI000773B139|nr:hypothetical protein [Clostridium botulinum]AUN01433.1 hypothetical protein RSJ19_00180 [Clostridium botulinum]
MIKNLLNVLKRTSMISWITNDDVPTMFNLEIKDSDSEIIIIGDVLVQEATAEMDILHNYELNLNKNNLIKFNKDLDVLTLFCKDCDKELILSC